MGLMKTELDVILNERDEILKEEILREVQHMLDNTTDYYEKLLPKEEWEIDEPKKTGLKFTTEPKPKVVPKKELDKPWNNPKLQFVNNKWVEKPEGKSYCYLTKEWLAPEQVKANIKANELKLAENLGELIKLPK